MSQHSYKYLLVEKRASGVAIVTMNRPEILNAINWDMHEELERVFVELDHDGDVRAIVLTGAGRGFCSGGDQKSLDKGPLPSPTRSGRHLIRNMLEVEVPVVAAVNGVAVGLGATLALFCDVIFANPTARFADTHVTAGVVAGDGGAVIWPLLMGPVRAKHYLMTGEFISAEKAAAMGMINEVVSGRDVKDAAIEYAELLADGPRESIIWTKYSVNKIIKQYAHLVLDTSAALEMLTFALPERREAVAAFAEKRKRFAER
ncbi:enoyl-CoA hydratase-related protein [Bradyrhizobium sp. INPA03-11B]|uniref:enoyl-CoA hydratase/isomerase family protein n=1 Tax=Bradyrhizobium sp. INPA03-11B TaxID=418598 RepID=UPI00338E3A9C